MPVAVDATGSAVATIFTKILEGELPGRFVWRDDRGAAFLSINPLSDGHTLVVPRREVDHWLDLEEHEVEWLHVVGQRVGHAIQAAFQPARVGTVIAGFEVPHVHLHVFATQSMADFDFARADADPDPRVMDDAARRIRAALRDLGYEDAIPAG